MRGWAWPACAIAAVAAVGSCGGETVALPGCVAAPAPATEASLDDVLRDEVRENAFAVSCGVDGARFGSAGQTCAGSASSCAEWLSCASGGHCPDFCADHGELQTHCDGNAQEACVGGCLWRVACATGTTCVDATLGAGSLSRVRPLRPRLLAAERARMRRQHDARVLRRIGGDRLHRAALLGFLHRRSDADL